MEMRKLKFLPFYGLAILPMQGLYFISDILFVVLYHLVGYRRVVVRRNLMNGFPDKEVSEIREIEKRFYHHFCDVAVEAIKTLTISEDEIKKRLKVQNLELLRECIEDGNNVLMYTAHQGNWEWLVYLPVYFGYPSYTFYRPLQNSYFDELLLIIRERFGVHCVPSKKGYRTVLQQRKNGVPVMNCLIGDQSPKASDAKEWCEFMHRETAFFKGPEKIAQKTDSAVLFPNFIKTSRGRYELRFERVEKKWGTNGDFTIINGYAELLEKSIARQPELWLWSHRRWKLSPPKESYRGYPSENRTKIAVLNR